MSACRIEGAAYGSVLVDRGYVPTPRRRVRRRILPTRRRLICVGVLRQPEAGNRFSPPNTPQRWYTRDVAAMAATLKAPGPAPLVILAETATNPDWPALIPAPLPADIPTGIWSTP
jgi:surfeit locus 1 family protein